MRIITIGVNSSSRPHTPLCACIGYFDGMHLGHQKLIQKTLELSEKYQCESALITFDPDPWVTLKGLNSIQHITTMRQRMNLAVHFGIENIVILKFTQEMSQLSPEDFVTRILGKLNLNGLVCGFDFRYGFEGRGDCELLKEQMDCEVQVVEAVTDNQGKISSTRISAALRKGELHKVNAMLGYPYFIEGTVIHGNHKGTGMGFPTANVRYSQENILPRGGVYAGFAIVDGKQYKAMINIGHNPTLNYRQIISVEAHLIGLNSMIYGKYIRLYPLYYLRSEMRFKNKDNLCMQLYQDRRTVISLLKDYE